MNYIFSGRIFLFCIVFILIITSACSKKYLTGTIYMGSGGGFAGRFKEYQLQANGDLFFKQSHLDSMLFIKTLDSAATKKIFRKYYKLKINLDDLDAPGNMYYYIGRRDGKFRNHKITYGNPEAKVSENIKEYYNSFFAIISDSTLISK